MDIALHECCGDMFLFLTFRKLHVIAFQCLWWLSLSCAGPNQWDAFGVVSFRAKNITFRFLWRIYAHICMYARIYPYMRTYMHILANICIYAGIYAYMHAYMHVWAHRWYFARIYAYMRSYMRICTHICIYARIFA